MGSSRYCRWTRHGFYAISATIIIWWINIIWLCQSSSCSIRRQSSAKNTPKEMYGLVLRSDHAWGRGMSWLAVCRTRCVSTRWFGGWSLFSNSFSSITTCWSRSMEASVHIASSSLFSATCRWTCTTWLLHLTECLTVGSRTRATVIVSPLVSSCEFVILSAFSKCFFSSSSSQNNWYFSGVLWGV